MEQRGVRRLHRLEWMARGGIRSLGMAEPQRRPPATCLHLALVPIKETVALVKEAFAGVVALPVNESVADAWFAQVCNLCCRGNGSFARAHTRVGGPEDVLWPQCPRLKVARNRAAL